MSREIPQLFGFKHASFLILDGEGKNLLGMSVDKEAERIAREIYTFGFEKEYVFDKSSIV